MDFLNKFYNQIYNVFDNGVFGIGLDDLGIIIASILFALIIRGIFAKLLVSKVKKVILKTSNNVDDKLFDALIPPFRLLPIVLVFLAITLYFDIQSTLGIYFQKINNTLSTIFVFWLIHQALVPFSNFFNQLEKILSKALVIWIVRSLKYLIIFLGVVAVLEVWGIKIGPVIAGLGLFGVAVALGAQDLFKNLISGILVLVEKRFKVGDWIFVDGVIEGIVEDIGFRSTVVRKFDKSLATIPNFQFAEKAVINQSETSNRRIEWIIGLEYKTTSQKLEQIRNEIFEFIKNDEDFVVSANTPCAVNLNQFSASSIDILIRCYTKTSSYYEWLKVKDKFIIKIKQIVESSDASFAFPSQSIYVEKFEK